MKNEKKIDKYYEDQKEKLLKNFSQEDIKNRYIILKKEVIEKEKENPETIVNNFVTGKILTKDYSKNAIMGSVSKFLPSTEIADEDFKDICVTMIKLYNSIYEYKNYLKFKYIIDDILKVYKEKDKYKNSYAQLRKQIQKNEKTILKLNGSWFARSSLAKQTKLVLETKELYKQLDSEKVYSTIASKLSDESSLYDVIYLASSFYNYLFDCIKKQNEDTPEDDIDVTIQELADFAKWPYFEVLNNIKITEDKDILLIIKDRYQLLNINISKDDLDAGNLDSLMDILIKCETYYYITKNNISLQNIQDECNLKKIIDQEAKD